MFVVDDFLGLVDATIVITVGLRNLALRFGQNWVSEILLFLFFLFLP